ncbi:hypothetical protein HK098_001381 [Nowakowskiella sp. JEL0407]|nr:hypothetical protein HK098_001381 [Nowakowskiella sp. JEL0407]
MSGSAVYNGVLASLLGSLCVGIGSFLQKYALNTLAATPLPTHDSNKVHSRHTNNVPFFTRFCSFTWLLGFALAYLGDFCGNWLALSFVSASLVTPLGIVSVMTSAFLASKYLGETITHQQRRGYILISFGVLLILIFAPKPDSDSQSQQQSKQHNSVSEIKSLITSESSSYGFISIITLILLTSYQILVRRKESLLNYVGLIGLFGAINVNCGKALSLIARLSALEYYESGASGGTVVSVANNIVRSPSPSPVAKIVSAVLTYPPTMTTTSVAAPTFSIGPQYLNTSVTETLKHVNVVTDGVETSQVVGVLLAMVITSVIAQEFFKQMALGKFALSQYGPISYAAYNCCTVLSSVILYREFPTVTAFARFFLVFGVAMAVILNGIKMVQSDDYQHERERERTD